MTKRTFGNRENGERVVDLETKTVFVMGKLHRDKWILLLGFRKPVNQLIRKAIVKHCYFQTQPLLIMIQFE